MSPAVHDMLWCLALLSLLTHAVYTDITTYRIINVSVALGAAAALTLAMLPQGQGLAAAALAGGVLLIGLFPLYLLGVMGAGDVKLLAALGCFFELPAALGVVLFTLAAGGVVAVLWALRHRQLGASLNHLRAGALHGMADLAVGQRPDLSRMPTSAHKVPYALAIALGTLIYIGLAWHLGWSLPLHLESLPSKAVAS